MPKKKDKITITGNGEDVIKASVKGNPKPKPKKTVPKKKIYNPKPPEKAAKKI